MSPFKSFFEQVQNLIQHILPVDRRVKYSVKKYKKTYELLEKYDSEAERDPEALADAGRLQPYIRKLQKSARKKRRANPAF